MGLPEKFGTIRTCTDPVAAVYAVYMRGGQGYELRCGGFQIVVWVSFVVEVTRHGCPSVAGSSLKTNLVRNRLYFGGVSEKIHQQ